MSVVYFIQAGTDGPVKIGTALSVQSRLSALQSGNAELLNLLATTPGGFLEEMALHRALARFRYRAEWFRWHPVVAASAGLAKVGASVAEIIEFARTLIADAADRRELRTALYEIQYYEWDMQTVDPTMGHGWHEWVGSEVEKLKTRARSLIAKAEGMAQ